MSCLPPSFCTVLLALATVAAPGCTHFANITEVPSTDGTPTYVSSRAWDDGTPRTVITERVFERPEAPCDLLEVEREFFDQRGALEYRQTDLETCGVVMSRVTEDYDVRGGQVVRMVQEDSDRDGMFEVERVVSGSDGADQLASLLGSSASR